MRVLVVTAVAAERDAIGLDGVLVGGVGPAASAAATSAALARGGYDLVVCAGIGGGFAPVALGDIAVASSIAFADLGAETVGTVGTGATGETGGTGGTCDIGDIGETGVGFLPLSVLGFGTDRYEVAPRLGLELADRTGGHLGTVLTVATVTGSSATAYALLARYPDAVAEGMEGAGVAAAAVQHGVPFGEIRAISNAVGPRDRDAWRIPAALAALGRAIRAVTAGWEL